MNKVSKACDISPAVRKSVEERDGHRCFICGNRNIQIAHYVPRSQLGLGIEQNLACMCLTCHAEYDNGKLHAEYKEAFKAYLMAHYEQWDKKNLIYRKG